ncbi:citrulline utilization hydrolase CtlX [Facilibium subflavum]|uniref:citrulline utilization hydrolase CtlX n=1 Tax=Facilibium subflavum TaxID=2219058 RepID=UPI000E65B8F1|nr:arginine deiminase-related protein [Facilibium subflavum]
MENITDTLVMVEPTYFSYNAQTAVNNAFQTNLALKAEQISMNAMQEFKQMVAQLKQNGIQVIVLGSPCENTPDAVFPNNWFSTHLVNNEPTLFIYPMFSQNRQAEVQVSSLKKALLQHTDRVYQIEDFRNMADAGVALEGTGVFVFDHKSKTAFMSVSDRADKRLAKQVTDRLGYSLVCFSSHDKNNAPVYHTNVMMSIGEKLALVCLESITDESERQKVYTTLTKIGKEVIALSLDQIYHMAANVLEVKNDKNQHYLLLSTTADKALTKPQKDLIDQYCKRLCFDITTIETIGGGSVRCMLAEVFYR